MSEEYPDNVIPFQMQHLTQSHTISEPLETAFSFMSGSDQGTPWSVSFYNGRNARVVVKGRKPTYEEMLSCLKNNPLLPYIVLQIAFAAAQSATTVEPL